MVAVPRPHGASQRRVIAALGLAIVLIAAYGARWILETNSEIARSDYPQQQVGGELWRTGHGSQIYVDAVQYVVYSRLVGWDHTGDLLFNHSPPAAVLAAPFSLLSLTSGFRAWVVVQLAMVLLACALVMRACRWPPEARLLRLTAVAIAMAGPGTLSLMLHGQDLGTITLGLAVAYAAIVKDRLEVAGAAIVMGAAAGKPHLALGLLAWTIGWRNRRILVGGLIGIGLSALACLLAVGWDGCLGFAQDLVRSNGLWPQAQLVGLTGLAATWLGEGIAANITGYALSAAALLLAGVLGAGMRGSDRSALGYSLAGATVLSLVASPHLYPHDLVLLAPLMVAAFAAASRLDMGEAWPGRASRGLLVGWMGVLVAAELDAGQSLPRLFGRLTVLGLIALAVVLWKGLRPAVERPPSSARTNTMGNASGPP